jgi:protein-L-isoaspartate(D-aspartate) O-methyltransferase
MDKAIRLLGRLGYTNILFKAYDGTLGWKEKQPFDAIIVTAGAPRVPDPLLDQLVVGGRMLIPIGDKYSQELIKVTKRKKGYRKENLGGCRFVDLIGVYGWQD